MGKRSRKQIRPAPAAPEPATTKRAALRKRADVASDQAAKQIRQRPPAPWDPFPLTELAVASGLILLVAGVIVRGDTGRGLAVSGIVLACIGGLDTALREHFNGYRSHAGLLAGTCALASLILLTALVDVGVPVRAGVAIGVFALVFPTLRNSLIRKSGGRGVL